MKRVTPTQRRADSVRISLAANARLRELRPIMRAKGWRYVAGYWVRLAARR